MGYENVTLSERRAPAAVLPLEQEALFEKMESTQDKVAPYLPSSSLSDTNYLKTIPSDIQEEAIELMDKICKEVGHKPLSRRLLELTHRISATAEKHIFMKREKDHEKKVKTEGTVQDQKSWKGWQATAFGAGGAGTAFCTILGNFIGGTAGQVLTGLANLSQPVVNTINTAIDGKLTPLNHESQLYVTLAQSEKQAIEGLKNLPEQLRNLVLELMRLEVRAIEGIAQR